jgi:hypothetical protein
MRSRLKAEVGALVRITNRKSVLHGQSFRILEVRMYNPAAPDYDIPMLREGKVYVLDTPAKAGYGRGEFVVVGEKEHE